MSSRYGRWASCLIVFGVAVGLFVSAAHAAAVRIPLFIPCAAVNAEVMAILSYVAGQDKTVVQIIAMGLPINNQVRLDDPTLGRSGCTDFQVDGRGAATLHMEISRNWTASNIIILDGTVLCEEAVTVHAVGPNPACQTNCGCPN